MLLKPAFIQAPAVKIMINLGALLDIPTGYYVKGKYGESILNGGLGQTTGIVGRGNMFKSTVMNFMLLSALSKILAVTETSANTYDTEINIHEDHLFSFTRRFAAFLNRNILDEGIWSVTDSTIYFANKWYEILKEFLANKKSNAKKITVTTPFLTRNGKDLMEIITPTFGVVDSFSRFQTEDVVGIQDANELGESGGNTMHMRQGLSKMNFLMQLPILTGQAYHYMLLTAHVGDEGPAMAAGPMSAPPPKKLKYMPTGSKIKGVTEQFTFLLANCWNIYNANPFINQGTKGPEYPRNSDDDMKGDTDLNIVSLRQLRGKSGQSGVIIEMIVSQSEGVLPELTEFHFIKSNGRFGFDGNDRNYCLDLYPSCNLSRTTVRGKIDKDPLLCRALNITSELCQMTLYWHHLEEGILCTPKELYNDLKAKGYDWDILLNTRGYWMIDNDKQPVPFLSTMDLLLMRKGEYHPYWYPVKKEDLKPV